jgi:hypothetical protein
MDKNGIPDKTLIVGPPGPRALLSRLAGTLEDERLTVKENNLAIQKRASLAAVRSSRR